MDVRLVLDRAAERDRQRKGGAQGRERAGRVKGRGRRSEPADRKLPFAPRLGDWP